MLRESQGRGVVRDFSRCPRCNANTEPAIAFSGTPSTSWLQCTGCNTYINTYVPQEHQRAVHEDPHTRLGNFGGYGTGKTTTSRQEIYKHIFITPSANILVGANVMSQYEQTIKRELEADIPAAFVTDYSNQKAFMDFKNGARIMYRPFDDPEKLRSYNLSMYVIVEASECVANAYHQLNTRLRNAAASIQKKDPATKEPIYNMMPDGTLVPVFETDWRKGIIESNPDSGWIRTNVLLVSDEVHFHGMSNELYPDSGLLKDESISSHIASSHANKYLPENFIRDNSINKPTWWVSKYIYSSFQYADGLVYPRYAETIVPTFKIPAHWKRIMAYDYGLSDPSGFLMGAVDPEKGILYFYAEDYFNNMDVDEIAKRYYAITADVLSGAWICSPIIDPKSGAKRDYNKKSLIELFRDKGIFFEPGVVSVDARVMRMNTYLNSGKLKIMDCCHHLVKELSGYKFPERTLDKPNTSDKPQDKDNHLINPAEWICMALPDDPKYLLHGAYVTTYRNLHQNDQRHLPWALQDTEELIETGGFTWNSF